MQVKVQLTKDISFISDLKANESPGERDAEPSVEQAVELGQPGAGH